MKSPQPGMPVIGRTRKRYQTWSVFSIGLGSLLMLMLVPSFTALKRSQEIYRDLRTTQENYERSQRALDGLARNMFLISIAIREFLLDTSPENDRMYVQTLTNTRSGIESRIQEIRGMLHSRDTTTFERLEDEIEKYWSSIIPVFSWSPKERLERGTYFLRQEQRPRRQSVLGIVEEIRRLNTAFYRQQRERINEGERQFRNDLSAAMRLAFLGGLVVAAASIVRIAWLEKRARQQREEVERSGQELRSLSTRLRHAQEEERRTISRELHDDVGQKLTALRFELGGLERLRIGPETEFRQHFTSVKELSEQSLRSIRDISAGLRPSMLDDLGLGPALQRQARQFSKLTGTPVTVEISGELDHLSDRQRTYIYRIVQESLTNCAKHSQAKRIAVTLKGTPTEISLSIEDDGIGFVWQKSVQGLGLIGIEERVRELGGSVTIASQPGKGTRLQAVIAVNGKAS